MLGGIIVNREWKFFWEDSDSSDYMQEVQRAHAEWMAAQNYFENVAEPDLVDYAIYELEAARRKYMYMLKKAGAEQNLS